MKKLFKNIGLLLGMLASFALTGAIITPTSASATGYTFSSNFTRVQGGEWILVVPNSPCPSVSPYNSQYILGSFTDSNNQTYNDLFGGTTNSDGSWVSAGLTIPEEASPGVGSLYLVCSKQPDMSDITRTYDSVALTVTPQTTEMTAPRATVNSTWPVSSTVSCPAFSDVTLEVYGESRSFNQDNVQFEQHFFLSKPTNPDGSWNFDIVLNAAANFNSTGFTHYIRASCKTQGNVVVKTYDTYKFRVVGPQYVALGDSYSSGEGAYNYYEGSCHRAYDAYAYYIDLNTSFEEPLMRACSGAVTGDVYSQSSALSYDTELVTLTIGGNDAGFADVLKACITHPQHSGYSCAQDTTISEDLESRLAALAGTGEGYDPNGNYILPLQILLSEIAYNRAPYAKIYIAGYPHLFGASSSNYVYDGNAPGAHKCVVSTSAVPEISVSFWDAEMLNDKTDELNTIIENAVTNMGSSRIVYVPPVEFEGHGLCDSGTSWINGVTLSGFAPVPESFHPNITGMQQGYGVSFIDKINE